MTTEAKIRTLASLPAEIFEWLRQRAQYHGGSISSEIGQLCRQAMEAEAKADTAPADGGR